MQGSMEERSVYVNGKNPQRIQELMFKLSTNWADPKIYRYDSGVDGLIYNVDQAGHKSAVVTYKIRTAGLL